MKIREAQISYTETEHEFQACELTNATRVVDYMRGAIDFRPDQEQVWVLLLDARLQPLGRFLCALGTVSSVTVHPREVFKPAILASASSIIFVHHHPSTTPEPSEADDAFTRTLSLAGITLGIPIVDHVVLGEKHYSYAEALSPHLEKP